VISVTQVSDTAELRRVYRELIVPSFRPGELLSEHGFLAQFPANAEALLASDAQGRMLGVAISEMAYPVILLQYLVASPAARGQGVGSRLLQAMLARWFADSQVLCVIAELDRPDSHATDSNFGDPEARLRFYDRFNLLALQLPYFQPAISVGMPREHGMLLTVFDPDGTLRERGRLLPEQSQAIHDYLTKALEHEPRDAAATRLLSAASAPGGIATLPLARYAQIPASQVE
jgi:GNAT superfamily N-acetyltransferase